jgi:REP element-mobilizing transposase RayT
MIENWLQATQNRFEYVGIDAYSLMPDHIHFILRIDRPADAGGHAGPPLQKILQWFKTMTTNEYTKMVKEGIVPSYEGRLWQRGYYEHIIRND